MLVGLFDVVVDIVYGYHAYYTHQRSVKLGPHVGSWLIHPNVISPN